MADKKAKKTGKTMGKKAMKKTKGGAVDAFIYFNKPGTTGGNVVPTEQISLNFTK